MKNNTIEDDEEESGSLEIADTTNAINTENTESKLWEKLEETQKNKEHISEDYTSIMNIIDNKQNEINSLKNDIKSIFILFFVALFLCIFITYKIFNHKYMKGDK